MSFRLGAALLAVEAVKKSETFSNLASMLGQNIDRVFRLGTAYRRFVITNEKHLRGIATNSSHLRWMLPHIDAILRQANLTTTSGRRWGSPPRGAVEAGALCRLIRQPRAISSRRF